MRGDAPRPGPRGRIRLVGAAGFEPATTCAQGRCATRLRYAPAGSALDGARVDDTSDGRRMMASWPRVRPAARQPEPRQAERDAPARGGAALPRGGAARPRDPRRARRDGHDVRRERDAQGAALRAALGPAHGGRRLRPLRRRARRRARASTRAASAARARATSTATASSSRSCAGVPRERARRALHERGRGRARRTSVLFERAGERGGLHRRGACAGENGFGYDPLFFYPPFGRTFGEVPPRGQGPREPPRQGLRAAARVPGGPALGVERVPQRAATSSARSRRAPSSGARRAPDALVGGGQERAPSPRR